MAITRIHKNKNFSIISNIVLCDSRLSNAAVGLICKMLQKPDNWNFSKRGLKTICKDGDYTLRTQLKELVEAGYLEIQKLYPDQTKSKRIEYIYHVHEIPTHCIYTETGEVYNTLTGETFNNQIMNYDPVMEDRKKYHKVALFLNKYLLANPIFIGTAGELSKLLEDVIQISDRKVVSMLHDIRETLMDLDIIFEVRKTKRSRLIAIGRSESVQQWNNNQAFKKGAIVQEESSDENTEESELSEELSKTMSYGEIERQSFAEMFTQHMMDDFEILSKVENHKEESSDLHIPTKGDDTRGENHSLYCLPLEERVTIQEVKNNTLQNNTLQNNTLKTTPHINTNIQSTKKLNTKELKTKRECAINEESSLQQKQTQHKETFLTHSLPLIQQTLVYPDLIQLFEQFILLRHDQGYSVDAQSISYLLSNLQLLATNKNFGNDPYPVAEKYILQMALAKQASTFFNLFDSEWQTIARQPNPYHSPSQTPESMNQPSQASEEMIKQTNQLRDEVMKLCQNGGPKAYVPDYRLTPNKHSSK